MKNELKLRKELYDRKYILSAIDAYVDICSVEMEENADYYYCLFYRSIVDVTIVIQEFENYLIGLQRKYEY